MDPYEWSGDDFGEGAEDDPKIGGTVPLVLHLGSRFVRVGFAGLPVPHMVVQAPFLHADGPAKLPVLPAAGAVQCAQADTGAATPDKVAPTAPAEAEGALSPPQQQDLAIWLSDILKGCAARSPYEKPVLLLEGVLTPPYLKHKVTELLLNYFQVPGVSFLSDLVAPLYTCGVDTGLVVDIG
ncbi:actin, alpha skeletal muscle-like [Cyclospora cayetanensis]|uniref:Actin, alpha skeletal muscle-like n=1 Tax=Cyclospora cayetanensis TaxID=88456 RepID=A0A6P6S1N0_9EIME|nr:actin, alpha skeletal muscle-like [Cyclospora cayetanensis]